MISLQKSAGYKRNNLLDNKVIKKKKKCFKKENKLSENWRTIHLYIKIPWYNKRKEEK